METQLLLIVSALYCHTIFESLVGGFITTVSQGLISQGSIGMCSSHELNNVVTKLIINKKEIMFS